MINIGGYVAKQGQILWKGTACVAFFPEAQIMEGRIA